MRDEKLKSLNALTDPVITALATKYGKSTGQIILNWHLKRGHIIIPKTSNPARLGENFKVFDIKMTDEEYESITKLDKKARFYDPLNIPGFGWNNFPYYA